MAKTGFACPQPPGVTGMPELIVFRAGSSCSPITAIGDVVGVAPVQTVWPSFVPLCQASDRLGRDRLAGSSGERGAGGGGLVAKPPERAIVRRRVADQRHDPSDTRRAIGREESTRVTGRERFPPDVD